MKPARMPSRWAKMLPWAYTERRQPTRAEDERRVIEPSLDEVLAEHDLTRMSPEEFDELFGDLPTDDDE